MAAGCTALLAAPAHARPPDEPLSVDLEIRGENFHLEVAADYESRARGLSGRPSIPADGGMIFLYRNASPLGYWMIDCLTDMDGIFLDPTGRILALHEMKREPPRRPDESQAAYERRLPRYPSGGPSPVAIELAPGSIRRLGLRRGESLELDMARLRGLAWGVEMHRMLERLAGRSRGDPGANGWSALLEAAHGAETALGDGSAWTDEALDELEARGIPDAARRALDAPLLVREPPRPWPDVFTSEDDVPALRALAAAETARLRRVLEAGDGPAAADALATGLRLVEALCGQASLADRATALGLEQTLLYEVRRAIEADRVGGAASALLAAIETHAPISIERAIRGEEVRFEAEVDLVFDASGLPRPIDPDAWTARAASGEDRGTFLGEALRRSLALGATHEALLDRPLEPSPTRPARALTAEADRFFRTWAAQAGRPRALRRTSAAEAAERAEQLGLGAGPLARLMLVVALAVEASDRVALERAAVTLMLGLEIHRAEHGRYPPALRDLRPEIVRRLPDDPLSGGPLRYRASSDGAACTLYSVGADRRDDGGARDPADPDRALDPAARGLDYVLFERPAP